MEITLQEARRLLGGQYGEQLQRAAHLYVRPLWWLEPDGNGKPATIRNGTTFFLDCGKGPFGVTAGHVFDEFSSHAASGARCRIFDSPWALDLRGRLISRGVHTDIATYRIDLAELEDLKVSVLTERREWWPPKPPTINQGIIFAGFPSVDLQRPAERQLNWGIYSAIGIATAVNGRDVSCLLEHDEWLLETSAAPLPEPGFDLGGLSGAPVLTLSSGVITEWHLAGVIYECARDLAEIVKAAHAHHIEPDGTVAG